MCNVNINTEISQRINLARLQKGLTQDDLARARGIAQGTVSQKLSGQRGWTIEDIKVYADLLGTTTDFLIDGKEASSEMAPAQVAA
jgi:transcriptional regulator with XRE-family HTH domain